MVQTVKGLQTKIDDPHLVCIVYRLTHYHGVSPSQSLMGSRTRTNVPMVKKLLLPQLPDHQKFLPGVQKNNYDHWHRTHSLPPLPNDTEDWVTTEERQVPNFQK